MFDPNGIRVRALPMLDASEQVALERITAGGGVRLAKERLPWPMAMDALRAAASS
ncbi:hypothetical protein QFZ53_003723 [Microbacterium natoriense]|uniref:Uncharacterized protein n=1 Tax=Microbacterium natoriense TaxID=284570 RepID=A0AAW8F2S1_9MICO|nr:hypothetical protein [Microbacterium natoriense]MDQ0649527.1 hypothetical protein [Microbacterium natoriense]